MVVYYCCLCLYLYIFPFSLTPLRYSSSVCPYSCFLVNDLFCVPLTDGADLKLRVVDGVTECSGRLEVKFQGEWGTICDDGWDSDDAAVACKQLGCPTAVTAIGRVNASEGTGHIWLDSVSCHGHESALWQCRHHEWGKHYCNHNEDAGVTCSGK